MPNTLCRVPVRTAPGPPQAPPGRAESRGRRPHRGLIVALVLAGGAASGAYVAYRVLLDGIERHSDPRPDPLPDAALSPAGRKGLQARLSAFRSAVEGRRAHAPLSLTAEEINALISVAPGLGGKVRVEIEGDRVRARFCLPLEDLGFPQWRGRYLNGTSPLDLSVVDGELVVNPGPIETRGGPLPEAVMARLRKGNLARLAFRDPAVARSLRRLSRVEVGGGAVAIRAR